MPALLFIKKISNTGTLTLGFTMDVIVLKDPSILFNTTYISADNKNVPYLEISVIQDYTSSYSY